MSGARDGTTVHYLASWGSGYDAGYQAGRVDALEGGAAGLLAELERYKRALVTIGRRGKPLPAGLAKKMARDALDLTGAREERREREQAKARQPARRSA